MKKLLKAALTAAALSLGAHAHAGILIDDFTVHQNLFVVATGNVGSNAGVNTVNPAQFDASVGCVHIIGCYRDIYVENNLPNSIGSASAEVRFNNTTTNLNPLTGGDELVFNVDSGSKARATVTWDGNATSGDFNNSTLLGNFSQETGFQFWVKSDGGVGGSQLVSIELVDLEGDTSTFTFPAFNTNIGGNVDLYILGTAMFGPDFVEDAGFEYSKVAGIRAIVNLDGTTDSLDFALRLVSTTPEPASLLLAGLALAGVGAATRRRKV